MKKLLTLCLLLALASCAQEQTQWAPVQEHILTRWAAQVDPSDPLPEYPRPQLVRDQWMNLNGLWDYAVVPRDAANPFGETGAQGQILVPYCIESALSGVGRRLKPDEALWYRTSFKLPKKWKGQQLWLNFQAVDWQAQVWVNGQYAGKHTGGYTAFSFNITPYLQPKGVQTLEVKVLDGTDNHEQPRGKQVSNPGGIWYTPVSGIWQTVWLEPTPASARLTGYATATVDDCESLMVAPQVTGAEEGDRVRIRFLDGAEQLEEWTVRPGDAATFMPADPRPWSPERPYLYGLVFELERGGQVLDRASGYAALREVKEIMDEAGHKRLSLNGEPYFELGPLDQGWWPDGLYTAPTDEALRFDIEQTKALGYNMIRKHIKVEPARWYYWCDHLGILVWQDMPCVTDSRFGRWEQWKWATPEDDSRLTESAKATYYKEWGEIIAQLQAFPCIVVWVPFNEGWAQFDTQKVVAFTKEQDPTRLVNAASGGNSYKGVGDIFDSHNYPDPNMKFWSDGEQIDVLGEFGGIGWAVDGHLWQPDRNWGYVQYKSGEEVLEQYRQYAGILKETIAKGAAAAVYTQTTDVEIEVNGLMTYDRAITKMDPDALRALNLDIIGSLGR